MSGGNIDFEIDSGGGENTYFDKIALEDDNSHYANIIAGKIVNEILENALDIATQASETGIHWKEIKNSRSRLTLNSSRSTTSDMQENNLKLDEICNSLVGNIVENIQGRRPDNVSDIIDSLNAIRLQENESSKHTAQPLDAEMKTLLQDLLSPPYQVIQYNCVPVIGAVGDQPVSSKSQTEIEICECPLDLSTKQVEKKTRVTDLLKTSPRTVSEYLHVDLMHKQTQDEWEETEEKYLNVIELECVQPGLEPFRLQQSSNPESPNPESDSEIEEEVITMPKVDAMDTVDLSAKAFREEELQLVSDNEESDGAKGDEPVGRKNVIVVHNDGPCEKMPTMSPLNLNLISPSNEKAKIQKLGIGRRIWGFFKKGNKQKVHGSSTST